MKLKSSKLKEWQILTLLFIIITILPSYSQSDSKSDYYFFDNNLVPSNFSYTNCTSTVANGFLTTNILSANSAWKANWTLLLNKDIQSSPFLTFSYKVGTASPAKQIGLAITLVINNIENASSNGTTWRLTQKLDASSSTWKKATIDLSSLIAAWKTGNPNSTYTQVDKVNIIIGTNAATLGYSGDLSIDSVLIGNYLKVKSIRPLNSNNKQLTLLFSRPVATVSSMSGFSLFSNGIQNPISTFTQPTDSTLLITASNPVVVSSMATTAVLQYNASSVNVVDKVASQIALSQIDNQSLDLSDYLIQSYWPYWGTYNPADISTIQAQNWVNSDGVVNGWDWSLPATITPSPNGFLNIARSASLIDDNITKMPTIHFPCNPLISHWIRWSEIEPVQGQFQFTTLANRVAQAAAKGYKSEIRFLFCRKDYAPDWVNSRTDLTLMTGASFTSPTFDPTNPNFHQLYLAVIDALGKSGLLANPDVVSAYVGWVSSSHGDEGICPVNGDTGDTDPLLTTTDEQIGKERLDHWAMAAAGKSKMILMGGESDYGFKLGFGRRGGFVEHYLYQIPLYSTGQNVDANHYLYVDETAPVIKDNLMNSDENEEYDESWVDRYGSTASYPFRFFSSSLRMLQMRCRKTLMPIALLPDLHAYMGNEMGRTVQDTPDAWCWLRENTLTKIGLVKNFERWLYQRDKVGYTTTPTMRIEHAIDEWMCPANAEFDWIARKGAKIGFELDAAFYTQGAHSVAIKLTYLDIPNGTLTLAYYDANQTQQQKTINTTGTNTVKTATFFVNAYFYSAAGLFDFELQSSSDASTQVPVILVRVIKNDADMAANKVGIADSNVSIYPNPVTDKINVTSALKGEISIVDNLGHIHYTSTIEGKKVIDSAELNPGTYFMKFIGENDMNTIKFIKK